MTDKIIMWSVCFSCAIAFFFIGVYAHKLKKPMWFWADKKAVKNSKEFLQPFYCVAGKRLSRGFYCFFIFGTTYSVSEPRKLMALSGESLALPQGSSLYL